MFSAIIRNKSPHRLSTKVSSSIGSLLADICIILMIDLAHESPKISYESIAEDINVIKSLNST